MLDTHAVLLANVGTPLMWASALHLLFGNLCIGVLEGVVLSRVFGIRLGRATGVMILANYFSAWIGWHWLAYFLQDQRRFDLYNMWWLLWELVAAAYGVTLLLEWPFVACLFWGANNWFRRSCLASLLVQSVSYVLLFGWYGMASGTSLITSMSIVPVEQMSLPAEVLVYYIADEDGDVYRRDLASGRTEKVFDLNSTDLDDCLTFEVSLSGKNCQEIVALLESGDLNEPRVVSTGVIVPNDSCPRSDESQRFRQGRFVYPGHSPATRLGTAAESPWTFEAGFWPISGMHGTNSRTEAELRFSLETPFVQWAVRRPCLLPTDRVLFHFGPKQICILEPETRQIALIAYGRGAVAVLKGQPCLPDNLE